MAVAVAYDDVKQNREVRDTPGGGGGSTIFLGSRDQPDFPHARLAEQDPGRYTKPHFHTRDQFQIVVAGKGKFGRHEISPYGIHFTRAYTPYGPLLADAREGMKFIVLRARFDPGSFDLPEAYEQLMQVTDRRPWQRTCQAVFPELQSDSLLTALPGLRDDYGLAAYTLSMKPDATMPAPDVAAGSGQYVLVVKGSVMNEGRERHAPALIFVWPHEARYPIRSGAAGLQALIVNFPRPQTPATVSTGSKPVTAGLKIWQCALCSFVYDEAVGMPAEGIAPGTRWEDVPESWSCPDCSASKGEFQMVERGQ